MISTSDKSGELTRVLRLLPIVLIFAVTLTTAFSVSTQPVSASTPGTSPTWTQAYPTTSPSVRYSASMAYDPATGNMVLFGGYNGSFLGDTWTWNGSTWTNVTPTSSSSSPSARYVDSMAYDPATGNMVLFGGDSSSGDLNDTWTWNGSTWTNVTPSGTGTSPSIRYGSSMAYDPATGNMVLFGGANSSSVLDDTWTWNGKIWTQATPANNPPALFDMSMAYDPATGNMVLFGGRSSSGDLNDTWTWNGSTWTNVTPTSSALSPSARYGFSMAYDPASANMVLFGGYNGSSIFNDTWTWNGSTWTQASPSTSPSSSVAASMAYDPATGNMVLFGGADTTSYFNETWSWGYNPQGPTYWAQASPTTSPPARYGASMAYDPATGSLVLFGGLNGSSFLNDTWTWNGTTWTNVIPNGTSTSPPGRYLASMVYDPATGNMVLFGGNNGSSSLNDTWTWNGSTWTNVTPSGTGTSPSARQGAAMAYDPATGNMVLFGGLNGSNHINDTWTWNGTTWKLLSPSTSPPGRWLASMVYDPAIGNMVLFGGYGNSGYLGDTWTWNGTTWKPLSPLTSPSARVGASMGYDPATGSLLLFSGYNGSNYLNDTWTWNGSTWTNVTPSGTGTSPPGRYLASMVYDPATGNMVLFGGNNGSISLNDTWTYQPTIIPPGPPTGLMAQSGTNQISLSWNAPGVTESQAPATGYAIYRGTSSGGESSNSIGTSTTTSYVDTSVTPGVTYYYYVEATNVIGSSSPSGETNSVASASVPTTAPTGVTTSVGSGTVTVNWSDLAASQDGASPITGYVVTASTSGTVVGSTTVGPTASSATIAGLTNGTTYTLSVAGMNSVGTGATSSTTGTPLGVPSAPTSVFASVTGSGAVNLTWSEPLSNGGSPITSYSVTSTPTCSACTITYSGTSATVTGLTNGTSYTFSVTATNGQGTGASSSPSNAVIPSTPVQGYWIVTSNGGVLAQNGARFYGSASNLVLNQPIVGMAATPDHRGYWLVAKDGGVFSYGDAAFYGSMGGHPLNAPIVGIASTSDGKGYYEVASDGGVFAFGDANFYGSMGGRPLNKPVVGMASTPDGKGYWLVASDGGVFAFGDANFYGSTGNLTLNRPIEAMSVTPSGTGYWFVASDGGVFAFGDANFYGSGVGQISSGTVAAMTPDPSGNGYWLTMSTGAVLSFGDAQPLPGTGGVTLTNPVVTMVLSG